MLYKLNTTLAKAICSLKRRHKIYLCFFKDNSSISWFRLSLLYFHLIFYFSSRITLSINQLNLRFRFCLQPLNLYKCFRTKKLIGFLNIQYYSTTTLLKDTPKKFSIVNFKYIDLNNFKFFKSFFILNNIRKKNGKFRSLLTTIIADPVFLIYSYKTIINHTNDMKPFELINNIALHKINIHWFFQMSQSMKNGKFKWSYNFRRHILKKITQLESIKNKIIQKAIYLVLSHIYENKLNFFSDNSYGFRQQKTSHSALLKIKFDWHDINWYLESYIEKAYNSLNQQILINIIKENIQDQALFSLLFDMLKIKTWYKNKLIIYKKGFIQTSIMSPFFINIYLTPLDRFIEKYINRYYMKTSKIKTLFFEPTSLNKLQQKVSKHIYNNKFTTIKYIRYTKNFIIAVLGKKILVLKIKESIAQFIKNDLLLKIHKKKTKLINVLNNSSNFLSYQISCNKKKYFSFSKPKAIEKKIRIARKIKLRIKINSDNLLKISADTLWKKYKKNPKKFLATIPRFEILKLNSLNFKIFNILKLNRRLALKKLAKTILLQLNRSIPSVDLITNKLLWNVHTIINKMENESKSWKKINSKKSLKPLDKIFIIRHILKFHSNKFLISQTKAHHVIKILVQKFPNLIWPIQVPQNIPLPPNINFKNITKKNKISYLAELINFLESIQYSIKNNFIIKKKLKFKNNLINVTKLKNLIEHSRHPIINANLKIIYQKLRKSDILKINSMKVNSKKSVLLFEDHKIIELFSIIARNILEYFSCCDNFAKAKFAVFYFIKFSLASTLKHKHKLSSIQKVFEIYGKNISVIHPKKVDTNISYITNYQINTWPKKFKNSHWDITKNFPFKNLDKDFSFLSTKSAVQLSS